MSSQRGMYAWTAFRHNCFIFVARTVYCMWRSSCISVAVNGLQKGRMTCYWMHPITWQLHGEILTFLTIVDCYANSNKTSGPVTAFTSFFLKSKRHNNHKIILALVNLQLCQLLMQLKKAKEIVNVKSNFNRKKNSKSRNRLFFRDSTFPYFKYLW